MAIYNWGNQMVYGAAGTRPMNPVEEKAILIDEATGTEPPELMDTIAYDNERQVLTRVQRDQGGRPMLDATGNDIAKVTEHRAIRLVWPSEAQPKDQGE